MFFRAFESIPINSKTILVAFSLILILCWPVVIELTSILSYPFSSFFNCLLPGFTVEEDDVCFFRVDLLVPSAEPCVGNENVWTHELVCMRCNIYTCGLIFTHAVYFLQMRILIYACGIVFTHAGWFSHASSFFTCGN